MAGQVFDRDSTRRVTEAVRHTEGRHRNDRSREAADVVPSPPVIQHVRVTSLILDAQGYYPGVWAYFDVSTATWSERDVVQIKVPAGVTLSTTAYPIGRLAGMVPATGKALYVLDQPAIPPLVTTGFTGHFGLYETDFFQWPAGPTGINGWNELGPFGFGPFNPHGFMFYFTNGLLTRIDGVTTS
jgi:hypothetical protein